MVLTVWRIQSRMPNPHKPFLLMQWMHRCIGRVAYVSDGAAQFHCSTPNPRRHRILSTLRPRRLALIAAYGINFERELTTATNITTEFSFPANSPPCRAAYNTMSFGVFPNNAMTLEQKKEMLIKSSQNGGWRQLKQDIGRSNVFTWSIFLSFKIVLLYYNNNLRYVMLK